MDSLLLVFRALLAAVFGFAGVSKLTDLVGSRKAIEDFGLPPWLAKHLAIALPLVEILGSVLLLPIRTALLGGLLSLVLLLTFSIFIAINIARGRRPDCHCFGQLHSKPIGVSTLVRNGSFALCAGVVVWCGPGSLGPQALIRLLAQAPGSVLFASAALGVVVLESWLVFHVFRQHGRLLLRMDELEKRVAVGPPASQLLAAGTGLAIGSPAPSFSLPTISGGTLRLDALRKKKKPVVLVFSDPNCGPCNALMPQVERWQSEYAQIARIAIISREEEKAPTKPTHQRNLNDVMLQKDREVSEAYQAYGTPAAVLIRPDGTIGSRVAQGSEAITALISTLRAQAPSPIGEQTRSNGKIAVAQNSALQKGQRAPSFSLHDLHGQMTSMSQLRGSDTLVLFWNPGCGFCQRMLPDLKLWEQERPNGASKLLLISTGTREANLAMGLEATVLLDESFSVGREFGAGGTPSGVLVDKEGKIASDLRVGASAVLALAKASPSNPKTNASLHAALTN